MAWRSIDMGRFASGSTPIPISASRRRRGPLGFRAGSSSTTVHIPNLMLHHRILRLAISRPWSKRVNLLYSRGPGFPNHPRDQTNALVSKFDSSHPWKSHRHCSIHVSRVQQYPAAAVSGRTAGPDTLVYSPGRGFLLFLIMLIAYLLVLILFISISLKFYSRKSRSNSKVESSLRAKWMHPGSFIGQQRHRACAVGWTFVVLIILAVEASVTIVVFIKPGYLAHRILNV